LVAAVGIRETVNQNPAITTGATLLIIALAIVAIVWQLNSGAGIERGDRKHNGTPSPATVRSGHE
jgi:hypothetical protein